MSKLLSFILICLVFIPSVVLANSDTGVQARVLPQQLDLLLEIENWQYENISDNEVVFTVKTNLPAKIKIEYGKSWKKEEVIITDVLDVEHYINLVDLSAGTLYYFNVSAFNNDDSVSLGDNTFMTSGVRKLLLEDKKLHKDKDENLIGADKKFKVSPYPEQNYDYKSDELFLLEDFSMLLLIFSLILVLFLIYRALKKRNEQKSKHWEKLDKKD